MDVNDRYFYTEKIIAHGQTYIPEERDEGGGLSIQRAIYLGLVTRSFTIRNLLHLKMKYITVIVAIVAVVQAQSLNDLPKCSITCLEVSIEKNTPCQTTDLLCVCKSENFDRIRGDSAGCVLGACGTDTGSYTNLPKKQTYSS